MGHDKLRKFAENETFACLLQPSAEEVLADGFDNLRDHPVKGHWFENNGAGEAIASDPVRGSAAHPSQAGAWAPPAYDAAGGTPLGGNASPTPLILELGCGKGEYTLELARRNPGCNYVGVDIKGARLWRGAKTATQEALTNVKFLRTRIEFITAYFAPGEVSEIWLTFSDPQPKSENNRLTSPLFLERYRKMLRPGGVVRLKTDSRFLYEYTRAVAEANGLKILASTTDLYGGQAEGTIEPEVREVQTFYESMFLEQGVPITYLAFTIDHEGPYIHPAEKFDAARWRELDNSRRSFGHQG